MKMVPLSEVAAIEREGVDPNTIPSDTPYLGLEHIERGGRIISVSSVLEAELRSTKFRFAPDHVLFGKLRPNLGKVARPTLAGVCSTDILPIRVGAYLDRDYLAHYLSQPSMIAFAASRASGANLPRLSPGVLAQFPVPLPALQEQRRIAAILDHADALRTKRRQALAHLDALTQSVFHDMFMTASEACWDLVQLGELVPRIDSGTSPVCETRPAMADEFGVLKLGAVTYGEFRENENKAYLGDIGSMAFNEVRSGDVLMTRKNTRELVGAVAVVQQVRPRLLLPDLVFRLHLDQSQVDSRFFQALMMSPAKREAVRNLSSGSAASMPNISKSRLRGLPLGLPPMDMQRAFSTGVERIDCERQTHLVALEAADELFQSLQSRAFKGEL